MSARLIWSGYRDGEQPYSDVTETVEHVMQAIDYAVVDNGGWPRLTLQSGATVQVNPAALECVLPTPEEVTF